MSDPTSTAGPSPNARAIRSPRSPAPCARTSTSPNQARNAASPAPDPHTSTAPTSRSTPSVRSVSRRCSAAAPSAPSAGINRVFTSPATGYRVNSSSRLVPASPPLISPPCAAPASSPSPPSPPSWWPNAAARSAPPPGPSPPASSAISPSAPSAWPSSPPWRPPVVQPLAARAERRRAGLVQRLPVPPIIRDALAVLAMDYTIYVWHVLTHKVPALWRFHLVHHIDLDLDSSTALRFHAADMLISVPWRAAQVALIGTSRRALAAWQAFFFASVLFHHSNLRLPARLERTLSRVLTTPRMHGIHHAADRGQTGSNWSSGLSVWDHLHGTIRLDPPRARIGVPAYRRPHEIRLAPSLALPFTRQRDAWS